MLLVCLHGFCGQSKDAEPFFAALKRLKPSSTLNFWAPDLFKDEGPLSPRHGFLDWARNFEEALRKQPVEDGLVFVGYSLGGRLLLHALAQLQSSKTAWPIHQAFFLSSNPGWIEEAEVPGRRRWEKQWSRRFLEDEWSALQRDWNALAVFESSQEAQREEHLFSRELLALALENWSVTRHERDLEDIKSLPQHWCFGSKDAKYKALGQRMVQQARPGEFCAVFFEGSGHRLLLDAPDELAQYLSQSM
ncbi:MAG: alpha/beta fold hydrolase [Planctomycetota bacterium]|nr:alpha/beta fold hydrolase [Planctomycetota bacterium]